MSRSFVSWIELVGFVDVLIIAGQGRVVDYPAGNNRQIMLFTPFKRILLETGTTSGGAGS